LFVFVWLPRGIGLNNILLPPNFSPMLFAKSSGVGSSRKFFQASAAWRIALFSFFEFRLQTIWTPLFVQWRLFLIADQGQSEKVFCFIGLFFRRSDV
jgi:hypothetical protein